MALSNTLLGVLNAITTLISLLIINVGVSLAVTHSSECTRALKWPTIGVGVFILVVSLAGFFGFCPEGRCFLCLYMVFLLLLTLAVLAFTIFAFIVTNKGAGHAVSNQGFKEYRLGDYSS